MIMAVLIAALGTQGGLETATFRIEPVTEAQIVAEFERTCLTGIRSPEALRSALARSDWQYEQKAPTLNGLRSNWHSRRGELNYIQRPPGELGQPLPLPQCNLMAFTRESTDEALLRTEIEAMLSRRVGTVPTRVGKRESTSWTWALPDGSPLTLIRIDLEPQGRQVDLSLQSGPGLANYDTPRDENAK